MGEIGLYIGDIIPLALFVYMVLVAHGVVNFKDKSVQEKMKKRRKLYFTMGYGGMLIFMVSLVTRMTS